jgi:hypothetical protein
MFSYVPHVPKRLVPHEVPQVLNVFLKGVPNNTSHYPISFAQSSPLLTYIGEPKGRYLSSQRKCYFGEATKFPVFFGWWAPINMAHYRKKHRTWEAAHLMDIKGIIGEVNSDRPLTNSNAQKTCVWEINPNPNAFQRLNVKDVNQNMICFKCF